jgi:hypothetical protein
MQLTKPHGHEFTITQIEVFSSRATCYVVKVVSARTLAYIELLISLHFKGKESSSCTTNNVGRDE